MWWQILLSWFIKEGKAAKQEFRGGLNVELTKLHDADPRNFKLDALHPLGAMFGGYTPKFPKKIIPTLSIKNQGDNNTCVCQSGCVQEEVDQNDVLSPCFAASYLVSKGQMNEEGTSIRSFQQAEAEEGVAEETIVPSANQLDFPSFSAPSNLSSRAVANANTHKTASYWLTSSLYTVLAQLDLGHIGQAGMDWYSGYNIQGGLVNPWILSAKSGDPAGGHAVAIVGYDLNYYGVKVLVCQNSWGKEWGDSGKFYVRFSDFASIISYATYFNLPLERDTAAWLSLNAGKPVIQKGGPKVYLIESDKKRWIPNEALMEILGILPADLVHDDTDMLAGVAPGADMTIADVPQVQIDHVRRQIQLLNNPATLAEYHSLFPLIF